MVSDTMTRFMNKNTFTRTLQSQVHRYQKEWIQVHKIKQDLKEIIQETKEDRTKIQDLKIRQERATLVGSKIC